MEIKDQITKAVDKVIDTVENIKDSAREELHRIAAQTEQQKRNLAGDSMTTEAKASSMIDQAKQTVRGDIDAMKRDERNKTST
jgi:phosphopantothenate synthetase